MKKKYKLIDYQIIEVKSGLIMCECQWMPSARKILAALNAVEAPNLNPPKEKNARQHDKNY